MGNNTISGLWVTSAHTPRAAYGSYHIATFVINKATAQPVMLADVFGDLGSALQRLSQNATTQLSAKLGKTFDPSGVVPTPENFANWIPTSDGIELHFNDYQVGPHGLTVITVPWAVFDGIATIRALRKMDPAVKIIVSSGLMAKKDETEAVSLGVNQFLLKPYTAATLLSAVRQVLGQC